MAIPLVFYTWCGSPYLLYRAMGKERIFLFPGNEEFLVYILKCFISYEGFQNIYKESSAGFVNICISIYDDHKYLYRYFQIPRIFPWSPATKVRKQPNSPIPGLKLSNWLSNNWQNPTSCPRMSSGSPPGMAADKCIIICKFSDAHWPYLLQVCIISTYSISILSRLATN